MKLSYHEQLRHALWRRRSNEICERDGWRCRDCSADSDLTVHHCIYIRGLYLWDYPDWLLLTVCRSCHLARQGTEEMLHQAIAGVLAHVPVDCIEKRGWELLGDIYMFNETIYRDGKVV